MRRMERRIEDSEEEAGGRPDLSPKGLFFWFFWGCSFYLT